MNPYLITEPTSISFSGGRTSGYMLYKILQAHGGKLPDDAVVLFANTGKEDEATLKFINDCSVNWNVPIVWLEFRDTETAFEIVTYETASRNGEPFEALIRKYLAIPNPVQRFCTGILKIRTMHKYLKSLGWEHHETNNADFVGIRADEERRARKMDKHKMPLYLDGIVKKDVLDFWENNSFDLELPVINGETVGGNCDLCFLKSLPKILTLVKQKPERAIWWAKMEQILPSIDRVGTGNTFRKDRPSYSKIHEYLNKQFEMFEEDSIECFCGD